MPRAKKATAEAVAEQAVATTEAPVNQLVAIEDITEQNFPTIFGKGTLSAYVEFARQAVVGEVPDLTTDKGRKRVASLAAQVARSKTALDEKGRDYLRILKAQPKVIEAELREFNTAMDSLRDEVRAPLNAWEQADADAKAAVQAAMQQIIDCYSLPEVYTAADVAERITWLEEAPPTEDVFGDRLEEAKLKTQHGLTMLVDLLPIIEKKEAEAAELEQLRKEKAEREQRENEERIAREAREKATRDLEEQTRQANQRAADAEAEAQRVRDNAASEAKRLADKAVQDERDRNQRAADEQRRAQEDQARADQERADDEAHRGRINKAALTALTEFAKLTEEQAKAVVIAIVKQQIPNVSIYY